MNYLLFVVIMIVGVIAYITYYFASKQNANLLLGTTLPIEHMKDEAVVKIVGQYRKSLNIAAAVFLLMTLLAFFVLPAAFLMAAVLFLALSLTFVFWRVYVHYMQKMMAYKKENELFVGEMQTITVDTIASSFKGRQGLSVLWYLIPAGICLIPIIWNLQDARFAQIVPLFVCFVPLILVGAFLLMHVVIVHGRTKVISSDSQINQIANHVFRRSWSMACFLLALISSMMFVLFLFYINAAPNQAQGILMLLYLVLITIILFFTYQSIRKRMNKLLTITDQQIQADEDIYWEKGYYDNPLDNRMLVEKRVGIGTTLNFGSTKGKVFASVMGVLITVLVFFLAGMIILVETSDFSLYQQGDTFYTEAPFYRTSFQEEDIVDVRLEQEITGGGTRTNGYGGTDISLGHFYLTDYGTSMLYIYDDKPPYLVIKLQDRTIIINGRTPEETQRMYELVKGASE